MTNYRDRRVAQEVQREVNDILQKKIRDPRVQGVTITDVHVTGDLQHANIYYSILSSSENDKKEAQEGLEKASGLIRKEIGQRLKIYKVPELKFELDSSVEYGSHIDELIREMNNKD